MRKILYSIVGLMVIGLLSSASISEAAMEIYLRIPEIPGESVESAHKDWIVVESISHQLKQSADATYSGTRTTGKVIMGDFVIVKKMDRASPKLSLYGCNGRHIPEATVDIVTTGGKGKIILMQYKLTDVIVTSVESTIGAGEDTPSEAVSFNFGKIEWRYTQIGQDGAPKGDVRALWDVKANTGN